MKNSGIVYLPVELPTGDYYGGHRPGNGLFGESLVAVDLKTGQRKWHYQLVHHGIWDMDIPCAPILADITVNGRQVKAVAQPTKQAFLYVFDRVTGQPIWPIEERPVEKGDVPGEWYSPTQPFPTKPPAYDRTGVSMDDLIDFTPELRAEAVKLVSKYKLGPMFTPPVVSKIDGPLATLIWRGKRRHQLAGRLLRSRDPSRLRVFDRARSAPTAWSRPPIRRCPTWSTFRAALQPERGAQVARARPPAVRRTGGGSGGEGGGGGALTCARTAAGKPPYGRITAIDLDKGEILWQIAHGETPDNVRNHPALKGLNIPRTGRGGIIGTLVTKTLVIAGEAGFFTTPPEFAARCCAPTTRRPAKKWARSTCPRRRAARR